MKDRAVGQVHLYFVHGFLGGQSTFGKWRDLLQTDSELQPFEVIVHEFDYFTSITRPVSFLAAMGRKRRVPAVRTIAQRLIGDIEAQRRSDAHCRIVVIGHSMGGLIARWAILHNVRHDKESPIDLLLTLATPHNGGHLASYAKKLPFISEQARELDSDGAIIGELENEWAPLYELHKQQAMYAFVGDQDGVICPPDSTTDYNTRVCPENCWQTLNADHSGIAKPSGIRDPLYLRPREKILDWLNETLQSSFGKVVDGSSNEGIGSPPVQPGNAVSDRVEARDSSSKVSSLAGRDRNRNEKSSLGNEAILAVEKKFRKNVENSLASLLDSNRSKKLGTDFKASGVSAESLLGMEADKSIGVVLETVMRLESRNDLDEKELRSTLDNALELSGWLAITSVSPEWVAGLLEDEDVLVEIEFEARDPIEAHLATTRLLCSSAIFQFDEQDSNRQLVPDNSNVVQLGHGDAERGASHQDQFNELFREIYFQILQQKLDRAPLDEDFKEVDSFVRLRADKKYHLLLNLQDKPFDESCRKCLHTIRGLVPNLPSLIVQFKESKAQVVINKGAVTGALRAIYDFVEEVKGKIS